MKNLIKIAAIASFCTAITTFFLWLLPKLYPHPSSFLEGIELASNPYYLARLWINFFHIPLALTAYLAFAFTLRKRESLKVILGSMWFLIWGLTEMIGVSGLIFNVNREWRSHFHLASESEQLVLQTKIEFYLSFWDSLFFVLLIAFLFGTMFYGWASWNGKGLEKIVSYLFWLAAPLTIIIILERYMGFANLSQWVAWIYPILQPISRFTLGLYLWKYKEFDTQSSILI